MPSKLSKQVTDNSYSYSGFIPYTVRGQDSLQSIAQRVLGDESLWPYIVSVNPDILSNDDLVAGQVIMIPMESDAIAERSSEFIISENKIRDPYGTDIRLDKNGNIVLNASNDVALVSAIDNVLQAIDVRLATGAGSMIKQTAFGLMASAGVAGTDMALKYVRMNVANALIQDTRVTKVSNVQVDMTKDDVKVSAVLELVNGSDFIPIVATLG